jgi:hypothetical protein
MTISIIQPCFIPWLGYFEQIAIADVFVYMDDVQYTKKDWRNNNQLKSPNGVKGVFVPVKKTHRDTLIMDVEVSYNSDWEMVLLNQLREWYRKAPYYQEVVDLITPHITAKHILLVDLNAALNGAIMQYIGIDTPVYRTSSIPRATDDKVERIIEICKNFDKVDTLYDGKKAKDFIDTDYFLQQGIHVIFQDYQHRPYPQLWGDFLPYMSILDLLMNMGDKSLDYIKTSKLK